MYLRILFAFSSLLLLGLSGCRQPHPGQDYTDNFFTLLQQGKTQAAYTQLFQRRLIPVQDVMYNQFVSSTNQQIKTYGTVFAVRLLHGQQIAPGIMRLRYMLYQQKTPSEWDFYYYLSDGQWWLIDLQTSLSAVKFRSNRAN